MKQIHKDYIRPFLLETTKLNRLMDIIHDRLDEHPDTKKSDDFVVFISGKRREEMTSAAELLNLDNSRKSKIERLLITCCASTEGAARPEHEIQVDFDGRNVGQTKTKVTIIVRSDNAAWSDRALSEVEEQVERTSLNEAPHRVALSILALSVFFFLLFLFVSSVASFNSVNGDADIMWLHSHDADRIQQILKQNRTVSDEEMREINTMQLRNVLQDSQGSKPSGWTRQKTFVGVPLLIVLGCVVFLSLKCYPSAVFLWGDELERYNKMIQTRRNIWNIIIGITVVGVFSNVLYMGFFTGQ
jgi:hypothetical protein